VNKPLIRFARRLSSWESEIGDDDLLQTEFWDRNRGRPDLRPSVYEIEPAEVVRAFAEHATAFNPPASTGGVDLGGTGRSTEVTPGETGFSFTMKAHRELVLADKDDLLALVRHVRGSMDSRIHQVSRLQVREYARARLLAEDEEWERAKADADTHGWLAKIVL
jgi:hypothetical protein